jgi:hypothetical protein
VHIVIRESIGGFAEGIIIGNTAGVGQQMTEGNVPVYFWQFGQVLNYLIIKIDLSLLEQQKNGGCGELFAHGSKVKNRSGIQPDILFPVGKTESTIKNDPG